MADLEACEKHGFDYIEIRFDCVKDYLKEHTLQELADWFQNHHLMLMYGKEANNRKQEIDRQHHTIPNQRNQRPKDKALWKCA